MSSKEEIELNEISAPDSVTCETPISLELHIGKPQNNSVNCAFL